MVRRPASSALLLALLLALVALPPAVATTPGDAPGGYELLDRVRDAYAGVAAYQDAGTLRDGDAELRFATTVAGDAFRFELAAETGTTVLWRDAGGAFLQRRDGTIETLPALVAGLVPLLGADRLEALAGVALLAGADLFDEPEAAAVDGPEPCGDGRRCHLLTLSRLGGALVSTLWVDAETALLHRVEVRREELDAPPVEVVADHDVAVAGGPELAAGLDASWTPHAAAGAPAAVFGDFVDVRLATLVARVTDRFGDAVADLAPEDFRVVVNGREVPVVAVEWRAVGVDEAVADAAVPGDAAVAPATEPAVTALGRGDEPVVYFFQADTNPPRIKGQLRLRPFLDDLVARFAGRPQAVVAFDSYLKLWQDFTHDADDLRAAMWDAMRFGGTPPPQRRSGRGLRLAPHLDAVAAYDVATPEDAMLLLGEALGRLPAGDKVVVYVGWGMGRFTFRGVKDTADFAPAMAALEAAGADVHVLDVSYADGHDLEIGLQRMASATGGTYAATHRYAARAVDRLVDTVAGRYLLTVDVSSAPVSRSFSVEVRRDGVDVEVDLLHSS